MQKYNPPVGGKNHNHESENFRMIRIKIRNIHIMYKGFTLIEVLITVTILSVITGIGILNLANYKNRHSFDLDTTNVLEALRSAQNKAILGDQGSSWGVKFTSEINGGYYEIFFGSAYATSSVLLHQSLSGATTFSSPAVGSSETVLFAKTSGIPDGAHGITLRGGTSASVTTVSVSISGSLKRILHNDLVGYWSLDEGSGLVAYDASSVKNNGTLLGGPSWQSGPSCKSGSCLNFDGTDDYIQTGVTTAYPNAVTVLAWVYHNASSDSDDIVAGDCGDISLAFTNNVLSFGGQCNQPFAPVLYSTNINAAWHQVAGVYDGAIVELYVDGNAVASSTNMGSFGGFNPFIGGRAAGSENFSGRIDDVQIYNRALSAAEIKNLYESY